MPDTFSTQIGADAVDNILGIIASSMLAVTTFSLSTMVSAYSSATSSVTPRATLLLVEDPTTQNALSTFVGAFLFSLVGIIALSTGAYGNKGRLVLYLVTIVVIVIIVYTMLRWIDYLARLGRMGETTDRIEKAAHDALLERLRLPFLGGVPYPEGDELVKERRFIYPVKIGYVQHIDIKALGVLSNHGEMPIFIHTLPGSFAEPTEPIASVVGVSDEKFESVRAAFTIGIRRSYEQDPRFGICVLSEIASRALSPAVNDPGTAIDIIGRGIRLFSLMCQSDKQKNTTPPICAHVYVPALRVDDMFDDFFMPIARDGAGLVEVGIRLQKALAALSRMSHPDFLDATRYHSSAALARAEAALTITDDKERLRALRLS